MDHVTGHFGGYATLSFLLLVGVGFVSALCVVFAVESAFLAVGLRYAWRKQVLTWT